MNSVMFFKSMWPEVKRNAALFVGMLMWLSQIVCYNSVCLGYMLGNLPLAKSSIISKEHVCEGIGQQALLRKVHFIVVCIYSFDLVIEGSLSSGQSKCS